VFTKQDSLRGSTKKEAWWDVKYYHLDVKVNPKGITGSNTIKYQVVQEYNRMQIDLQNPLKFTK
jgi:hypothetical protein